MIILNGNQHNLAYVFIKLIKISSSTSFAFWEFCNILYQQTIWTVLYIIVANINYYFRNCFFILYLVDVWPSGRFQIFIIICIKINSKFIFHYIFYKRVTTKICVHFSSYIILPQQLPSKISLLFYVLLFACHFCFRWADSGVLVSKIAFWCLMFYSEN